MCRSCGAPPHEGARFCDQCGSTLTASVDSAQYKQVTVLFADVVRSMDIAADLDLERFREIMTTLVERSAAVVRRYGGTVEFTGDGVMAIFGAPISLEDHAFRACLAALAIQEETKRLASDVQSRDDVALRVRVGLNSGRVIAGEVGSGSLGHAAIGEQIGLAQRMESVAPPGGVMLSESTARLVEHAVMLGAPEWVRIKGSEAPVQARRLVAISPREDLVQRAEASLVGRRREMAAVEAIVDRTISGRGGVVAVVGSPGIGKSRMAREAATLAAGRGVEVFWTFCESHARDVPFRAIARLLRVGLGVTDLDGEAARAQVREQFPDAEDQDLVLLDDLVGIADPEVAHPQIDADARRRRLTALINAATLARTDPALYVIEDAHWIDAVSESLLAEFLAVIPRTPSMALITSRPEYRGVLTRVPGAQTITLGPLDDSDARALIGELLGSDSTVGELAVVIADRASGNPFFAEEMVRELVQRGVLAGERGGYLCRADVAELSVPATVQAAIAARIDKLTTPAKRTLHAASVIGARFGADLLAALDLDPVFDQLLGVELIDQVRVTPNPEYAFRHPLIRAVAYESQLKSTRAQWHRRLAGVIQDREPGSVEENAALIAGHWQAAGELHTAYGWHMRAGAWSASRDFAAARLSWERARTIADALPDPESGHDPDQLSMRIAPRTMLCGTAWRVHMNVAGAGFNELRDLCTTAGDKASLAIGMATLVMDHAYHARIREAAALASEHMALIESLGDPNLMVGLSLPGIYAKMENAEFSDMLRWTRRVIDLADGDPSMGDLLIGSPLAFAYASRAIARYCLGRPGWRDDLRRGLASGRSADAVSYAAAISLSYFVGIANRLLRPDDSMVREIEDALRIADRSGDDLAVANAQMALGMALLHRQTAAQRDHGQKLLAEVGDVFVRREHNLCELPIVSMYLARERARRGDRDAAIPLMRATVDHLFREGRLLFWSGAATGVLVETLLDQVTESEAAECDLAEAEAAIERLAAAPAENGLVLREIWLLPLRALLARSRGDDVAYQDLVSRYRAMAESLGFEGHIAWAEAMIEGGE